uniref:Secreted protein n=1 Tax=Mesocestoides corti TaxID=53468 RepID=A0A5K3FUY2_MESCO
RKDPLICCVCTCVRINAIHLLIDIAHVIAGELAVIRQNGSFNDLGCISLVLHVGTQTHCKDEWTTSAGIVGSTPLSGESPLEGRPRVELWRCTNLRLSIPTNQ